MKHDIIIRHTPEVTLLDLNHIRDHPDEVRTAIESRQMDPGMVDKALDLDTLRRSIIQEVEGLKAQRNSVSKEISRLRDDVERQQKIESMRHLGENITHLDEKLRQVDVELQAILAALPNIPSPQTPIGKDEHENIVIKTVGEIPALEFEPLTHWDLGARMGLIDFDRGVKITGSRFYLLSGAGARLQRALIAFMLDQHIRQGYMEQYPPFVVRQETLYASGQLPKFADNLYHDIEDDLWLVPTAEVPLTGIHMGEVLEEASLPRRYTAYTPCFRREKMSAGRDVRGIKRGHQFDKVEMYSFCKPEHSNAEFDRMLGDAEQVCDALGLPYRILQLCTGDLGFTATKTCDIEVWAAGCQEWLEVSSISLVGDFQARRANIKYRSEDGRRPQYVHTLNGSGLALPRTLIAIMENNQQADGSIAVPQVLSPWMGGISTINSA